MADIENQLLPHHENGDATGLCARLKLFFSNLKDYCPRFDEASIEVANSEAMEEVLEIPPAQRALDGRSLRQLFGEPIEEEAAPKHYPSRLTEDESRNLLELEQTKKTLLNEEILYENRIDGIVNTFSVTVQVLVGLFTMASILSNKEVKVEVAITSTVMALLLFGVGVGFAWLLCRYKFKRVEALVENLQTRSQFFTADAREFVDECLSEDREEEEQVDVSEREKQVLKFRLDSLTEMTGFDHFIQHYKNSIYLMIGLAAVEVIVIGVTVQTVYKVIIPVFL